jgi:TolB-like protein
MKRLTGVMATLVLLGGVAFPGAAFAQGTTTTVAVVPFNVRASRTDTTAFVGVGTALADLLSSELGAIAGVRVLDRGPVSRTAALQPKTRNGFTGREGAVTAARALGAQHVVFGGFAADGSGNIRLDARAVNVGTGVVETTERLQGRGDDIASLVHQLALRLETAMSISASGAAAASPSIDVSGLAAYGRALEASDRGDRPTARQLLEGVLREHPDFTPAKAAMAAPGDH